VLKMLARKFTEKRKNIYHTLSYASVPCSENYVTKQYAIICVKAEEIDLVLTEAIKLKKKRRLKQRRDEVGSFHLPRNPLMEGGRRRQDR